MLATCIWINNNWLLVKGALWNFYLGTVLGEAHTLCDIAAYSLMYNFRTLKYFAFWCCWASFWCTLAAFSWAAVIVVNYEMLSFILAFQGFIFTLGRVWTNTLICLATGLRINNFGYLVKWALRKGNLRACGWEAFTACDVAAFTFSNHLRKTVELYLSDYGK